MSSFEMVYDNLTNFLSDLYHLEKDGYFFRGVEKQAFIAQASVFRPMEIKKNRKSFPISYSEIQSKWFYNSEVMQIIRSSYQIPDFNIKHHPGIHRLFELLSYLMVCNYLFSKYKEDNPQHMLAADREQITDHGRGSAFWMDQEKFNHMVGYYFPKLLTLVAHDKSWRQEGYIDEIITGIDMSFPQHYDVKTAALDFSKNNLISIYFAIEEHLDMPFEREYGLYIPKKAVNYTDFLSIYAVKLTSDEGSCPIEINEIGQSIPNPRAKNQQGVLCYFSSPCSFYMSHGRFPAIEDYLINHKNKHFDFKKLSLKRTVSNLDFLAEILEKENINKAYIYPTFRSKFLKTYN